MEQRKPLGLLQPTSAGVLAKEYRLCVMLPGGVFSSVLATGAEPTAEPFSIVAGPKGCEVFESVGENYQKLPTKVSIAAREVLSKVAQLHQERYSQAQDDGLWTVWIGHAWWLAVAKFPGASDIAEVAGSL